MASEDRGQDTIKKELNKGLLEDIYDKSRSSESKSKWIIIGYIYHRNSISCR